MMQTQEQPRKRKEKPKLEFEAGKVFEPKAAEEFELDRDAALYKAKKGQGGDRRA